MTKDLVVKDNALINASYNLDLTEQRLILLAIVEARAYQLGITSDKPLTVYADSYATQFNVERHSSYGALKDACKTLFNRQFSYQEINKNGNTVNILSRWVSEVRYIDNEAKVQLIFAPAVVPMILELEKHFTSYELEQVSELTSAYAVRLYELLIAWRSSGNVPMIELNEFRLKLGVLDGQYKAMCDFKKHVLDVALNQINEHTDIKVEYEQHKRGRIIIGFSFKFKSKKPNKKPKLTKDYVAKQARPGETQEQVYRRLCEEHGQQRLCD